LEVEKRVAIQFHWGPRLYDDKTGGSSLGSQAPNAELMRATLSSANARYNLKNFMVLSNFN
jgi:hypothetical protein